VEHGYKKMDKENKVGKIAYFAVAREPVGSGLLRGGVSEFRVESLQFRY